jgi:hypothetical protein
VEILSPDDKTRSKIPFYETLGVRELLLVDRDPWQLELYELQYGQLALAGQSCFTQPSPLESKVVPFQFRLIPGPRPSIEVICLTDQRKWLV